MESTHAPPADPATLEPLETRCAWRRDTLADSYVHELSAEQVAEVEAALVHAEARVDDVLDITQEHFPLPTLGPVLAGITDDLINGRGVALLRGLPVERYSKDRAAAMYWGIGMHVGNPWPQNAKGHLLGDVTDQGKAVDDPTSRGNEIGGVPFPFHSDGSDLVGLLCLDPGLRGGASLVANVVSIHNELVRDDPDLAAELYASFPYDFRGEQAPGARGWYEMPIFTRCKDRLFARYIRPYIEASRRHDDAPEISPPARAAMDRLDELCADPQFHVSMTMQPGDVQLVNNYHVLHAREGYEDDRPAGRIRHLKRLWLETSLLTDDDKPERFRLGRTDSHWASRGRTKSEVVV
jgi:hypothetical protein